MVHVRRGRPPKNKQLNVKGDVVSRKMVSRSSVPVATRTTRSKARGQDIDTSNPVEDIDIHEMETQVLAEDEVPLPDQDDTVDKNDETKDGGSVHSDRAESVKTNDEEAHVSPKELDIETPPDAEDIIQVHGESMSTGVEAKSRSSPDVIKGTDGIIQENEINTPETEPSEDKANHTASNSKPKVTSTMDDDFPFPDDRLPEGLSLKIIKDSAKVVTNNIPEDPAPAPSTATTEENAEVGKLRSSVADAEGMVLASGYGKCLRDMEEYSLNFLTQEIQHPVITCFRELTRTDISTIISCGKLKKACSSLELSVIYLGLIDLMATTNNNPLYGENCNAKFSKNVASIVQKILLEFKNIIGSWALSGKEVFTERSTLILRYLRLLGPMFAKPGFEKEFIRILDSIENEVARHKSNQEIIKTLGSFSPFSSSVPSKPSSEGEIRSALNEIVNLNINIQSKMEDSEDDDVVETSSLEIFGKPLKSSPKTLDFVKRKKKLDDKLGKQIVKPSSPKVGTGSAISTSKDVSTSVFKNKNSYQPNTNVLGKRIADEDLRRDEEITKRRKLEESDSSPLSIPEKSSIRNFFQSSSSSSASLLNANKPSGSPSLSSSTAKSKPAVNAFAIMMKKSKELAQKKKMDQLNAPGVPALKMRTVKT